MSASKLLSLSYTTTTTPATSTDPETTTTTATDTIVTANPGHHMLKFSGTLGLDLNAGMVNVVPYAGVDYAVGGINGFTESGASAADLTVERMKIQRTDAIGGLNITTSTGLFRPYARAAYRSQIGSKGDSTVTAYFNGDPTTQFTVDGVSAGRHEVDVDAGVNVVYNEGAFFVGYLGTIRKDMSDHGLHAGVRFLF